MQNDQLTRLERIRLEAFAQVTQRHAMRPIGIAEHFMEAEDVVEWLLHEKPAMKKMKNVNVL